MVSILVIGDTHIPDRAEKVPEELLDLIESGKPWDLAVFTGDFTSKEVFDWFTRLGRQVYYVRGNMDYLPLPKTQTFRIDSLVFGVHHGDGIYPRGDTRGLTRIAKHLKVDVLISGHTHAPFIKTSIDGTILLLNPGSLTGVWGGGGGSMRPSMMILEVTGNNIDIKLYELLKESRKLVAYQSRYVYKENKKWVKE